MMPLGMYSSSVEEADSRSITKRFIVHSLLVAVDLARRSAFVRVGCVTRQNGKYLNFLVIKEMFLAATLVNMMEKFYSRTFL